MAFTSYSDPFVPLPNRRFKKTYELTEEEKSTLKSKLTQEEQEDVDRCYAQLKSIEFTCQTFPWAANFYINFTLQPVLGIAFRNIEHLGLYFFLACLAVQAIVFIIGLCLDAAVQEKVDKYFENAQAATSLMPS